MILAILYILGAFAAIIAFIYLVCELGETFWASRHLPWTVRELVGFGLCCILPAAWSAFAYGLAWAAIQRLTK